MAESPQLTSRDLSYSERHPIQKQAWDDGVKFSWQQIAVPGLGAIANLIVTLVNEQQAGRLHDITGVKTFVYSLLWSLVVGVVLYAVVAIIRAPFVVIGRQSRELIDLRHQIATAARTESVQPRTKPELDLQIYEAFINPSANTATVFLHVSLHNETGPRVANPPSHAYSLSLVVKKEVYQAAMQVDPEQHELGFYKRDENYDEDGERHEGWTLISKEPIYRISTKSDDLVPGTRLYGWIAFVVRGLPPWATDRELVGVRTEYDEYYEDGEPNLNSAYPEDVYKDIPHTRDVEAIALFVRDAYDQEWHATTLSSYQGRDKRIIKREIELPPDV